MSRYQTYKGTIIAEGEISEAQQKAVDRVMDTMDLLYGSALMWILMMTKVPLDTRSYSSRGWCARAVAPSRALARCVTLGRAGAIWSSASGASSRTQQCALTSER